MRKDESEHGATGRAVGAQHVVPLPAPGVRARAQGGRDARAPGWAPSPVLGISRRRALGMAATAAGATAVLAACGGRNGAKPSAPAASTTGKPKLGGQLNVWQPTDPFDFDPTGKSTNNRSVMVNNFDSLLSFRYGPGVDFNEVTVQPGLAEKWESPDGITFTFHLRKGIKFAGRPPMNGRELTSADAKWSMEYISRTGPIKDDKKLFPALFGDSFAGLADIQTPDAYTVVYHFSAPNAPFLSYSAAEWNPILAHEVYDQYGNFSDHLGGTGPFQIDLTASQKGSHWISKKNPTYYLESLPYIDQINEIILPDDSTTFAAFRTKQIDFLEDFTIEGIGGIDIVKQAVPDVVSIQYLDKSFLLVPGTQQPPMNDARVRKALALSIDHDELVKVMTGGKGQPALASALPGAFTPQEIKQILKYDPNQAKQLLAQAGFPNGLDLEYIYPTTKYGQQVATEAQLLQSQVKKGGFNMKLVPLADEEQAKRLKDGAFQLIITGNSAKAGEPDGPLFPTYYSTSGANYGRVKDPQLDKMLEAQRAEVDPAKRKQLVRDVVKYITDNAYGIGLYDDPHYYAWHPYLKNFAPLGAQMHEHFTQSWLEK